MSDTSSALSSAVAVYTIWSEPVFSSIATAVSPEVIVGAASSRSLISRMTDCASPSLPAASVAITAKLYSLCAS